MRTTHYLLGSALGPHPYPTMVAFFHRVIGVEARRQCLRKFGRLPAAVVACVGGGSNAIGIFQAFLRDRVRLYGVEAGGRGRALGDHAARFRGGRVGILHGTRTYVLEDSDGQIASTHSVSAGLDYPAIGPQHARLRDEGRVEYAAVGDRDALRAFALLTRSEGIVPRPRIRPRGRVRRGARPPVPEVRSGDRQSLGARRQRPRRGRSPGESVTHSRLAGKFEAARRDGRACFIPYLTAGDPDLSTTVALARELDRSGADVLELGVPFSDPIADGPTLQRAAGRALAGGTTLAGVLECAAEIRRSTGLALVLFSYVNPLFSPGFAQAMRRAAAAGFDGVLLTDVPAEEASDFLPAIAAPGLDPIFLVSPTFAGRADAKSRAPFSGFSLRHLADGDDGGEEVPREGSREDGAARAPLLPETAGRRRIRHFEGRRRCSRGRARGRRRRRIGSRPARGVERAGCRRGRGAIRPRNGGRVRANTAMNDNELKRLRAAIDESIACS